jgi:nucleoside-diphosphate-sugar epimerase
MKVLICGGTGPSGYYIVEELLQRGHEVTIFHSGSHEREFSGPVEHIHGDLSKVEGVMAGLEGRRFDVVVNTGGRIKPLLEVLPGKTDKLVSISGFGVYEGGTATGFDKFGAIVPIPEGAPKRPSPESHRFYYAVAQAEKITMEPHEQGKFAVTILRYPMLYGPHSYWRYEWYLVKRILDGRRQLMLPGYGMTLLHRGHGANMGHAAALAIENPKANGQIYNTGDERLLSTRQIVDMAAKELNHEWELVPVPYEWAPDWTYLFSKRHVIADTTKIKTELGYRDVVPIEEGMPAYLRWLADNPALPGSPEAAWAGDIFDYAKEDELIKRAKAFLMEQVP